MSGDANNALRATRHCELVVDSRLMVAAGEGDEVQLRPTAPTAPDELVIWPPGWIQTTKYEPFLLDDQAAAEVIAAFEALGTDLVIDYEHATLYAEQRDGTAAPAAGWITALKWDEQRGLLASVKWTQRAAGYIASGEYRYHSPVAVVRQADRRMVELCHASLTNEPATINAQALAASRYAASLSVGHRSVAATKGESVMNQLLTLLGLGEDATLEQIGAAITEENAATVAAVLGLPAEATREEVLAAVGGLLGVGAGGAAAPEAAEELAVTYRTAWGRHYAGELAGKLKLTGDIDTPEKLVTVASQRIANPPNMVHASAANKLREEKQELAARLEALEKKDQRREFETLINTKEHTGKVTPAVVDEHFEIYCADHERYGKILAAMPRVVNLSGDSQLAGRVAGTGGPAASGTHEYEEKIAEIKAARHCSLQEAQRSARREHKQLFEAYRKARKVNGKRD